MKNVRFPANAPWLRPSFDHLLSHFSHFLCPSPSQRQHNTFQMMRNTCCWCGYCWCDLIFRVETVTLAVQDRCMGSNVSFVVLEKLQIVWSVKLHSQMSRKGSFWEKPGAVFYLEALFCLWWRCLVFAIIEDVNKTVCFMSANRDLFQLWTETSCLRRSMRSLYSLNIGSACLLVFYYFLWDYLFS